MCDTSDDSDTRDTSGGDSGGDSNVPKWRRGMTDEQLERRRAKQREYAQCKRDAVPSHKRWARRNTMTHKRHLARRRERYRERRDTETSQQAERRRAKWRENSRRWRIRQIEKAEAKERRRQDLRKQYTEKRRQERLAADAVRPHGETRPSTTDPSRLTHWCVYCQDWHWQAPCPTPEKMTARCQQIQATWDAKTEKQKRGWTFSTNESLADQEKVHPPRVCSDDLDAARRHLYDD